MFGTQSAQQDMETTEITEISSISSSTGSLQTTSTSEVTPPNQVITSQAQDPRTETSPGKEKCTIWEGLLEWIEKPKNPAELQITRHVPCQVSANLKEGEPELNGDGWPSKLIMHVIPKQLITDIGGTNYFKNSKSVLFHPQNCEALESLTKTMRRGFAGCVYLRSMPDMAMRDQKILILLYAVEKREYLGFIPHDQVAFICKLQEAIEQQRSLEQSRHTQREPESLTEEAAAQQDMETTEMTENSSTSSTTGTLQTSSTSQATPSNQIITSKAQAPKTGTSTGKQRCTIWEGLLEWIEKDKNSTEPQKITRHVLCQVSANSKDGEPELNGDGWPSKLIMQLMPKQLIGDIGGTYLKNSKRVVFYPQNCEALESLTKVMSTGFGGCVHFTGVPNPATCDIKVLVLLYAAEKRAYLGFIPNNQTAFVDRLRKVIEKQKQIHRRQSGTGGKRTYPPYSPTHKSKTDGHGCSGKSIRQNRRNYKSLQNFQGVGVQVNQAGNTGNMTEGPLQAGSLNNNIRQEILQNFEKINQLKETIEATKKKEQKYKRQLERISRMNISRVQEVFQIAQQLETKFRMLDQQAGSSNETPEVNNSSSSE